MFSLVKFLVLGALGLMVLIPAGIALAVVGLPIIAVLGLLALPVLLVLFLVGLPFLIVFSVVLGLLGAVFGVVMAFLSVGIVAVKITFMILIPLMILGWIVRRVFEGPSRQRLHS
jgi:hypothetical protein